MTQITECPNCGKKGLVQRGNDAFQCLSCNFSRDLSNSDSRGSDIGWVLITGLLIAVFFKLFQFIDPYSPPTYSRSNTSGATQSLSQPSAQTDIN